MNLELLRKVLANKDAAKAAEGEARDITLKAWAESAKTIRALDRAEAKGVRSKKLIK